MDGRAEIAIVNLPKLQPDEYIEENAIARQLAEKTRDLRLHALAVAPNDFASTYEVEVARGLEQTFDRLRNTQAEHFIAVKPGVDIRKAGKREDFFRELSQAEWIGMVVLIGPLEGKASVSAASDPLTQRIAREGTKKAGLPGASDSPALRYHLNGVFVEPSTRTRGLGTALMDAALDKARSWCLKQHAGLSCSVLVDSENTAARKLYEKGGFVAVGEEAYAQMPRSTASELAEADRVAVRMESMWREDELCTKWAREHRCETTFIVIDSI
ncbi:hypothetical protein DOTSEDRAFT_68359 [Dothistroma septosporum NZE10]|uniref:N-acetyltransferase domain-containing protein n=1 Tax=Dothistroma septosporum (strain NZE10 / CBS 128990) TaxID=675120 RepID=N1Q4J9_DOTSN|nr:hypothetical protein DOTSEDRAFT_68359 [Dothistroma septosporum NZE10]